ncbi:hypothetical protein [Methylocystis sp.]|uniref:hypothetical protein n=1 Tax=Methylocystis sp. TaxID=1911079 RepID=UPI003D13EC57
MTYSAVFVFSHRKLEPARADFRVVWRTALINLPELLNPLEAIYEAAGERIGEASKKPLED